jgi:NADH-quinone oxidoreductase subunit N
VNTMPNFLPALPEIVLTMGAMLLLLLGAFRGERGLALVTWGAVILLIAALVLLHRDGEETTTFGGAFVLDQFAVLMKSLTIIGSAAAIIMSDAYMKTVRAERFEFPILIVLATVGMMMMISAGDLIALYLGLELQSLALYVIAAIRRDSLKSTEAGLKYFVLGALSSGMLLYGSSLLYGFTGTISFAGIAQVANEPHPSLGILFALAFISAGLAFKVSAVPFHMWTPDVYEGAPTPVTAFFSAAPKIAAMDQWQQIIVFISIASMGLGAFAAIAQRNIKRLLAYSSIGHMGFALVGLASGSENGIAGVIIYLTIYLTMTLGTFACVLSMRRGDVMVEDIDDLAGLAKNQPLMAAALAILMFSLAGIPPLAGFFAKFYVFLAAIEAELYPLAVIGVLASVVGAFYYLRIIKIMYFDDPAEIFQPMPRELAAIVAVTGVLVLVYFIYPSPVVIAAKAAAHSLF